jgi:ribosomal protein S6--L-glutamate ligase
LEEELALRSARTLGLGICGVDILPTPSEPVVVEVNPSPGFRHLEAATGVDVAAAMAGELLRALS